MIKNIEVSKLVPHPNNPRKDLGDLTELTSSIQENGVLQNLTVVPTETYEVYRVVIGHRRLEASIRAGQETVPCVVVEMDEKKQQSTMLLENMQRSDLTPYEQAQGIQTCLDLGMTEADISKKTGFSKSTVRRRVKMLELDQEKVKQSQGTIDDYIALESIEDVDVRNNLMKYMGTNNFLLEVEKAKTKEEKVSTPSNKSIDSIKEEESEIIKLSKTLRINFMVEVFKRKIAPNEIALSAGIINTMFINGLNSSKEDIFNKIVNPNGLNGSELVTRMLKHRSNFLVVAAFDYLESKGDYSAIYEYLQELRYVISDEEQVMIDA